MSKRFIEIAKGDTEVFVNIDGISLIEFNGLKFKIILDTGDKVTGEVRDNDVRNRMRRQFLDLDDV